MKLMRILTVAIVTAVLSVGAAIPALGGSTPTTIQFTTTRTTSAVLSPTTSAAIGTDNNGAKVIGTYELHITTGSTHAVVNASFALSGGLLYANARERGKSFTGSIVGGTGVFSSATGTFAATGLTGASGAVVIVLSG